MTDGDPKPRVALFVTCLVDLFRPSVGFAAVALLERAGCEVFVPSSQTCCGQPAYNSGDRDGARAIARALLEAFAAFDYVVAPSGSCAGMLRHHLPDLFETGSAEHVRAVELASRTHELISFLTDVRGFTNIEATYRGVVTYHDGCSGLWEMGVREQPRALLGNVSDLTLRELANPDICCGFGGTFCVKYPDISNHMVGDKTAEITNTGADTVLAGDMGCLLNIAGKLGRDGSAIRARHIAEVLANMTDAPPIVGSGEDPR